MEPIIKRQFNPRFRNMTFDQWDTETRTSGDRGLIIPKLLYFLQAFEDFTNEGQRLFEFWTYLKRTFRGYNPPNLTNQNIIKPLISLAGEANLDAKIRNDIISVIDDNSLFSLKFNPDKHSFDSFISANISWSYEILNYCRYLEIESIPHNPFDRMFKIFDTYFDEFENIRRRKPIRYFRLLQDLKGIFKIMPENLKTQNRVDFQLLCLKQISHCKENGFYSMYKQILEDYYTQKLFDRKISLWLFKNFIGFGENPSRLAYVFFLVSLFFSLLFSLLPVHFNGLNSELWWEKVFHFLYFCNTTMLTVGYGDIYPIDIGSRFLVIALQIFGFVISSSFVVLITRKILRF
jgi:hypothetical protein